MSDKRYEQPKNSESEKSCGDQSSKNQPKKTKQCVVMSGAERKMEDNPDTFAQPKTKKPNLNRFESKSSRVTTDEGIKQHKKSFGEKRYKNDKDEDWKSIQKLTEQYSKPMSSWNEESVKTTGNYAVETKALAQCKMDSPAFEEECCKEYDPNNYRVALYSWGLYYIRDNHIQLHDHGDTSEYDELINMVRRFSSEENFAGLFDGTTQW